MRGGKALTGCGCMQGTTFPLMGMGTPVGTVSPVELTSTKEEVSTPGVKVLRESFIYRNDGEVFRYFMYVLVDGNHLGSPAGIILGLCYTFGIDGFAPGRNRHSCFNSITQ